LVQLDLRVVDYGVVKLCTMRIGVFVNLPINLPDVSKDGSIAVEFIISLIALDDGEVCI
jgi:hypothetical protein